MAKLTRQQHQMYGNSFGWMFFFCIWMNIESEWKMIQVIVDRDAASREIKHIYITNFMKSKWMNEQLNNEEKKKNNTHTQQLVMIKF